MNAEKTRDPHHKKIMSLYGLFVVTLMASMVPSTGFAVLALFMITALMILAYVFRAEADEDSLLHNHTSFVIRTLWIAALFSVFTIAIASAYMIPQIDYSQMDSCVQQVTAQLDPENVDYGAMNAKMQPCMDSFIASNRMTFLFSMAIAAGPLLLYMLFRLIKGVARARHGHKIGNLKNWF
ncbi:MAG: hypothetical protein H6868_03505 [Rhodospirillales bacterium]|nr:hypothetical protein [Rhodospirillales bacterium]